MTATAGGPAVWTPPPAAHTIGGFYAQVNAGVLRSTHHYTLDVPYEYYVSNKFIHSSYQLTQDSHRSSATLGGGVGYGFVVGQRWYAGIDFDGQYNPGSSAHSAFNTEGPIEHVQHHMNSKIDYQLDMALTPGVLVTDNTLMYAVVGASYAHAHTQWTIAKLNGADTKSGSWHKGTWGFKFGGGLRHYVTHNLAVYGETDYYDYKIISGYTLPALPLIGSSAVAAQGSYSAKLAIHSVSYKVGVLYHFM